MKKMFLLLGLALFFMAGVIAPGTGEELESEDSYKVDNILLKAEDNGIEWEVEGESVKGFKVVWSKTAEPTYPTRSGDKYHYYSDAEKNEDVLEAFDGEGEYYVRVCEYLGGECGVYSNEIVVNLTGEAEKYDDDKEEEKEKDVEKEEEKEMYKEKEMKEEKGIYGGEKKSDSINDMEKMCNSCLEDGVCYSFENRKDGKYCSYESGFVEQKAEEVACDNNFECESNVCVSGECVSGGLIEKVLSWFRNFFG